MWDWIFGIFGVIAFGLIVYIFIDAIRRKKKEEKPETGGGGGR